MRSEEHQAYSFEDERKRIKACFCAFVEGSLVSHDIDAVLQLFCDDVIGIGMGAQGIVRCREDLRPILMNTSSDVDDSQTAIDYSNMQVRYYGDDYASINAMVSVTTTVRGERRTSHIGPCASLRRIDGQWRINMVQATPLSIDIQDIDSYPLSFAEDEIENYRRQAQFSSIMRRSIIATYKIDFESDSFEEYVAASGSSVAVQQGDPYERIMQESAMVLVDDAMKLEFISTFSIANLKKCYRAGQTDVTLGCKAAQICEAVRHIHPAQNGGPGTSVSIGIARRESGDDFDSLYRKADAALYQRKEALGRDGYTIYGDGADS